MSPLSVVLYHFVNLFQKDLAIGHSINKWSGVCFFAWCRLCDSIRNSESASGDFLLRTVDPSSHSLRIDSFKQSINQSSTLPVCQSVSSLIHLFIQRQQQSIDETSIHPSVHQFNRSVQSFQSSNHSISQSIDRSLDWSMID